MATLGEGFDGLSPVEQALVKHVEHGELLDLSGPHPVTEATMRSWDANRAIRAHVVRDIVRGRLVPNPDPHGLRLRGARIAGRVDLENITSTVSIELENCLLDDGLNARDAHLSALVLSGCRLAHPDEPALDATRLTTTVLTVYRAAIDSHSNRGAMNVSGARISGELDCTAARLRNDSGPALYADGLQVDRDLSMLGGFTAAGAGELGALHLRSAHIGNLHCENAWLRNDAGPALYADGLQVDRDVFLSGAFTATGAGELGALRLPGAHIGGQLYCAGARLRNDSGPALYADGLQIDQDVRLDGGFEATGTGELGALRLPGAHIGGQLYCVGARLRNDSGPALHAEGLQVDRDVFLSGAFTATGAGELGALRLPGAHIGGRLDCAGARLRNNSGPALHAGHLQVDQDVRLDGGFEATGAGELGTVYLLDAHVGGRLDCAGARLRNDSGPALHAEGLQIDRDVLLFEGFEAAGGGGESCTLELGACRIGGFLAFDPTLLEHSTSPQQRLFVYELVYHGLPLGITPKSWLMLLSEATPDYAAQPYQQLAAAHQATGHDREARRVLMRQRRDQINRKALTGRGERAWARFTGLTLGYGYQPWRALIGLLLVIISSVLFAVILGAHGGLTEVRDSPPPTASACTVVERIEFGLDVGVPLITTGARDHCAATNTTTGQVLTVTGWALRLLAWAFATLFIAGFTGAVRKS